MPGMHMFWVPLLLLVGAQGQTTQQSGWQQQQQQLRAVVRPVQRYTPAAGDGPAVSAWWHDTPSAADATALGSDLPQQQSRPLIDGHSSEHLSNGVVPARRLSATSQAPVAAAGAGALPTPTMGTPTRQGCPSSAMAQTAPGCTCTVYRNQRGQGQGNTASSRSSSRSAIRSNLCPSGYRCSPSAAIAIFAAGWSRNSSSEAPPDVDGFTTERGICIPCQLGEYCPVGSQEDTLLSLSACDVKNVAINQSNTEADGTSSGPGPSLMSGSCSGVKLCPGGSYCPSAAVMRPCEPGRWCPEGSTKSQPCNITGLLVWNPFRKAPGGSQLIIEALVKSAQPFDGNSCPFNATNPLEGCEPGYFCPSPAEQLPCPAGFYCPGHTTRPVPCPVLGSCTRELEAEPAWSMLGVLLMLLLLLLLLMLLEYLRVSGRCRRKAQTEEEDVMQLIEAVGFKMVGQAGSYQMSRTALSKPQLDGLLMQSDSSTAGNGQVTRSGGSVLSRALRGVSSHFRRQQPTGPSGKAARSSVNMQDLGSGKQQPGDHAVLTVTTADPLAGAAAAATANGRPHHSKVHWLLGRRNRPQPSGGQDNASVPDRSPPSMLSPFQATHPVAPSSSGDRAALSVLAPPYAVSTEDGEEEAGSQDYSINPRLTLVFRDVWVADIPIEEGVLGQGRRKLTRLCRRLCRRGGADDQCADSSGSSGGHWHRQHANENPACTASALEEMYAKLEAAAAAGAYFIVPGVSSRFAHSQLHAIMGPSGCGKTTLCKALAGRLPLNRICGDVRLLCSSAADAFHAEVELTAAGTAGGAAAACNISHMTGFVPQFDQLHETLTVLENLLLAAKLRLPVSHRGRCGCTASDCTHWERVRHREVHKVVGEVMALMALTKVATTVVGSSSQRTLSGGQRKRVAIGMELVSKPSLLWLDEPTSGLDAAVAYDVVAALKASSERGMNVLAVMHQPRCSIFGMFDTCLLLSSAGNVVYSGPQRLALPYMAFLGFYIPPNENLADFLLDVISGVVPRPGDDSYIPSQLATMWHKAGGLWVQQQLRKAEQKQQQDGGLEPTTTVNLTELLPVPPAVDPPDWPWRPRDLEALLSRFNLLVDSSRDGHVFGRGGFGPSTHAASASVLSYDGFLSFWDESGIKELLGEAEFAEFIEGLCEEFGMKPDACITRQHFVEVLKSQLRAAAAAAAAPDVPHALPAASPTPKPAAARLAGAGGGGHTDAVHAGAPNMAAAAAPAPSHNRLARKSAFEDFSNTPLEELDAASAADPCGATAQLADAALTMCEAAAAACAEASVFEAAAAACAAEAGAGAACASAAAAAGRDRDDTDAAAAEDNPEVAPAGQLSRSCSSAGFSHGGDRGPYRLGVLTCPQTRLRAHNLMQQRTLQRQLSRCPDAASGPSVTAEFLQRQQQCQQMQQTHMEALLRCRKARQAALAAAAEQTGLRQVSQARMMQGASFVEGSRPAAAAAGMSPCVSLQEARARCLDQLGDFLVMQESQQLGGQSPLQANWSQMCTAASMPDALLGPRPRSTRQPSFVVGKLAPILADSAATMGDALPPVDLRAQHGSNSTHGGGGKSHVAAEGGAAAAAAAAAAVSSRRLPPLSKQLQLIMLRSSWKSVLSRSALSMDLILTSILGLALGVAQGRNIEPSSSLTWMLITMLAYGAITLVRSTRTYGNERHIYLQQESSAGVSVIAWVFGHQVVDMFGLLLHPLLFYAWMYVLTLTPVPAWSYFTTLVAVGFYTSGIGYLVSLTVSPSNVVLAALAVALLLGGVANGVVPNMTLLEASHPLLWLDWISYTMWGLQALYISWLIPTTPAGAPSTATFLSSLGFCGLEPGLLRALSSSNARMNQTDAKGVIFNATAIRGQQWWNMTSADRATALNDAAMLAWRQSPSESRGHAAAAAAISRLWQYYNHPQQLDKNCQEMEGSAMAALIGLGLLCRLVVWALVRFKVHRKAQQ